MTARVWVIILSVIESIQLLVLTGELVNIFPSIKRMDSEVARYVMFCVLVVGIGYGLNRILAEKIKDDKAMRRLRNFGVTEMVITGLLITAMYKLVIYDYRAELARSAYQWLLVVSVLNKVLWFKIEEFGRAVGVLMTRLENRAAITKIVDILFVGLIILIIYVPDPQAVVARMFIGEQFHHNDSFIMGPAWAYLSGNILNVDTFSQYGLGMPVVIGLLSKFTGGFSYEQVFQIFLWASIAYFLACYLFLRLWLRHALVAMAGIFMAIKWQMCHTGVYPFVFTYGSTTVLRYPFDIIFFLLIYAHLKTGRRSLLMIAGVLCGAAIFYLSSEGIYLWATYLVYLLMHAFMIDRKKLICHSSKDVWYLILFLLCAPVVAMVLLFLTTGKHIFSSFFWQNSSEFIGYFLSGFGTTPMYASLLNHHYLASIVGFVIPAVYVLTMTIVGALCFLKIIRDQNWLAVLVCVYGLSTYHYYVARSEITSYYVVCVPFVFVLCFWLKILLDRLPRAISRPVIMAVVLLAGFSLLTNHTFIAYPNRFNLSANPMVDPKVAQPLASRQPYFHHMYAPVAENMKLPVNSLGLTNEDLYTEHHFLSDEALNAYYRRESDFSRDAELIARLTPKDARVALISSFEIKILMQANRRPFFYYFPLVIARPMKGRSFVMTSLYTQKQMAKTLAQLEVEKPEYVFMERVFLIEQYPEFFKEQYPGFIPLLKYVHERYTAEAQGEYLVAMKRK